MTRRTNNSYLADIAASVGGTSGRKLNNEYLKEIADGITGVMDPATGKVDATKLAGVVPAANLPSYVDDVVEGYLHQGVLYEESTHVTQITPEAGKVYVDPSTNTCYRWSGSGYVSVGGGVLTPMTAQEVHTITGATGSGE